MKPVNYTREDIIRRASDKLNLTHDEMKIILDTFPICEAPDK